MTNNIRNRSFIFFLSCCCCVCLGLGVWQLQRLIWKTHLLQQISAHSCVFLSPAQLTDSSQNNFYGVHLQGTFIHSREVVLQGRTHQHLLGFHVLTPFRLSDGREILVNRGWVSPSKRKFSPRPKGQIILEGILYPASPKRFWTPDNQPAQGEWYWINLQVLVPQGFQQVYLIAQQEGGQPAAPNSCFPPSLPNNHLGYAITWFALAAVAFAFIVQSRPVTLCRTEIK